MFEAVPKGGSIQSPALFLINYNKMRTLKMWMGSILAFGRLPSCNVMQSLLGPGSTQTDLYRGKSGGEGHVSKEDNTLLCLVVFLKLLRVLLFHL